MLKLKVGFVVLILLNMLALYYGASPFFVTFAQLPIPGICTPDTLGAANHAGAESMRDFLFSGFKWLLVISFANLAFAATAVLHKLRATT